MREGSRRPTKKEDEEFGAEMADLLEELKAASEAPLTEEGLAWFERLPETPPLPAKVLLESVRRFKGLERPVIVLTGIGDLPASEEQALLYVGLSRARVHLIIVATGATMERVARGVGRV